MTNYSRLKFLCVMLGLLLTLVTQHAFCASDKEPIPEMLTIPLSNEAELTFTMPMKSRAHLYLLRSKSKSPGNNFVGRITITDQDCTTGHQVSITYGSKRHEYLTVYFPKETPWDATYKLRITRNAEKLTFNLNGETISVTPYQKATFIQFENDPKSINILNTEQHSQQ